MRKLRISEELDRHLDSLYQYALLLAGDDLATRLVETTCMAAAAASPTYTPAVSKKWLFVLMKRTWSDQTHGLMPSGEQLASDCDALVHSGCRVATSWAGFDLERVRTALHSLSPGLREILLLREFEKLPYHDIASILGCSYNTVVSRLACARSVLCNLLSGPQAIY